jgi:hypothetical protein
LGERLKAPVGQQEEHAEQGQEPRGELASAGLHLSDAAVLDVCEHGACSSVVRAGHEDGFVGAFVEDSELAHALGFVERHSGLPGAHLGVLWRQPDGPAKQRERSVHRGSIALARERLEALGGLGHVPCRHLRPARQQGLPAQGAVVALAHGVPVTALGRLEPLREQLVGGTQAPRVQAVEQPLHGGLPAPREVRVLPELVAVSQAQLPDGVALIACGGLAGGLAHGGVGVVHERDHRRHGVQVAEARVGPKHVGKLRGGRHLHGGAHGVHAQAADAAHGPAAHLGVARAAPFDERRQHAEPAATHHVPRLPLPDAPAALEEANHDAVRRQRVHLLEPAQQREALRDLQHGRAGDAGRTDQLADTERQVHRVVSALEAHVVAHLHEGVERSRRGGIVRQPQVSQARLYVAHATRGEGAQGVEGPQTSGAVRRGEVGPELGQWTGALLLQLGRVHDGGDRRSGGGLGLLGRHSRSWNDEQREPRRRQHARPAPAGGPGATAGPGVLTGLARSWCWSGVG